MSSTREAVRAGGALCALLCLASPARALDKQGSAHGGDVGGSGSGFGFSGSAGIGVSIYNPTYAARPDNTGNALMRYFAHADVDLIGQKLSIPLDVNMFTDRERGGALMFSPTELDFIEGLTSTWELGPGAIEFGLRGEIDAPLDKGSYSQRYVDFRTRYLFSAAAMSPGIGKSLGGGDISGWATLGVFAINPTYAARPDNSGNALLRYALHVETSFAGDHVAIGLDGTTFTDRETNVVRPCELDLTPEFITRFEPFEFHIAYERDMPLDDLGKEPGYVQSFVYALAVWSFDLRPKAAPPPTAEGTDGSGTGAPRL